MPDLTIETRAACEKLIFAMKYGVDSDCMWTQEVDSREPIETDDGPRCPECGGPVGYYNVGV